MNINIDLKDMEDQSNAPIKARITPCDTGIEVTFDGHSDNASVAGAGCPIFIEHYEGEILVRIYADINSEAPTHTISLAGARDSRRIE